MIYYTGIKSLQSVLFFHICLNVFVLSVIAIYNMHVHLIAILYFVVVLGAKVRSEIYEAFENIYPILKSFRKT